MNGDLSSSLSKYLAQAGVCSRRQALELIKSGRVTVDGVSVTNPAHKIYQNNIVKVGNRVIRHAAKVYILLNKPKDYIATVSDEKGRKTVLDLVKSATKAKIYPVGRLDRNTTGLLLLTNDGELTNNLSHPRYGVQKTYNVTLDKPFKPEDAQKIKKGVKLEDGIVKVDNLVSVFNKQRFQGRAKITLHTGRYRVVRRLFEYLGYEVVKLDRIIYAGLTKKGLPIGRWRKLTPQELDMLKNIKK